MPSSIATPAAALDDPTRPAWRYARERRLGRISRQLVDLVNDDIPLALELLGEDAVLDALDEPRWALACLRSGAVCDEGSDEQGAWVLLAACRPRHVRHHIYDQPTATALGYAA